MRNFVVATICFLALLFGAKESCASTTFYHVVKAGETVFSIAKQYGVSEENIRKANGIGRNNFIETGEALKINKLGNPEEVYHVVKAGETVYSIAKEHGVSIEELRRNNGIGRNNLIEVGEPLRVPGMKVVSVSHNLKKKLTVKSSVAKSDSVLISWATDNHINLLRGKCASYEERMKSAAKKHGFDWRALPAIAGNESSCDPEAVGKAGEEGMYQFLPETARMVIKEHGLRGINLFDPDDATEVAALHFSDLLKEFKGDYNRAIAAWNMGKEEARKLKEPSDWTYVKRVTYIYRLFV